jgi:thiol-disulfide isomerase/thioredoxin
MFLRRYLIAATVLTLTWPAQANAAPLPKLVGKTEQGAAVDLAAYKGKVVLLFFWSTECAVCLDQLPEMRRNLKGWRGKDFLIIAVNQDHAMANLNGSSPISGERCPDLEEEIGIIAVAVGHTFDDLDLVVDALDQVGSQRPLAVRQDAG